MKKILFGLVLLLAFSLDLCAQTADEILTKHFNAIGINKLITVNTIKMVGKITATSMKDTQVNYLAKKSRPYRQYMELNTNGEVSKSIFDGRSEWAISKGKTVKNPFDVEEQRKRKICFEGDLFYCKNNGYKIEYNGLSKIEGLDFHTIKVTNKDGYEAVYYIDPGSFMLMKSIEGDVETYYSNFTNVEGVILPFSLRVVSIPTGDSTELDLDTIEFNKDVEESLFSR